ncbi:hypothetical protein HPB48_001668 [Haemaphysalis longicornis]|uniref:Neurotransmitter-gated ion-channel ligand-binding domain-containing protein n=1 Tax=Haemaphysalis longicornis TaxID=44386 RepID=A0A9J6GPH4_HAELO|nr:hypothetical protein HPB48_001668 [Haemaphysalis longicornis]
MPPHLQIFSPFFDRRKERNWKKEVRESEAAKRDEADSEQGPHERRLLADLLANYNTLERPMLNESEPLILSFGLTLQHIIGVLRLRLPNREDYHHIW